MTLTLQSVGPTLFTNLKYHTVGPPHYRSPCYHLYIFLKVSRGLLYGKYDLFSSLAYENTNHMYLKNGLVHSNYAYCVEERIFVCITIEWLYFHRYKFYVD